MRTPTFVSMTTLPSRIDRIRPTIESLLGGSHVPDKVLIALPSFSQREQRDYVVPAFLDEFGPSVEVVHCGQDWGPGTKLLGSLDALPEKSYLVLADDDVIYKPSFSLRAHRGSERRPRSLIQLLRLPHGRSMGWSGR